MVKDRIDQVNSLNAEELKALYKQARLNSRISEVGGAGLGFIDVARKTENKLEFAFFDIDSENYKYFTLKTQINKIIE
jgi:predicted O-methyltransferase YrrM